MQNNNLEDLVKYLNPLLAKLSSSEMSKLNKKVGADLRRSQQQRISAQLNPDGSNYVPRRLRQGNRIRNKMFSKLRTFRYLRNFSNADKVSVGFLNNVVFVARIHQEGLSGRVDKNGPVINYPKRELLGFTDSDIKMIENSVLKHLGQ
ncbi:phage virion morphogenesis protein [Acinetobacter bereziniae]|uniref:phage virion morphogenesis protein n=1 Tax=Acinetobacter bereziniae TaxID=106648 RepID=UPI0022EB5E3D|nr:phage virion morphogenesis protein [Acinetobacter bereziniae]MDA3440018.1 phage virion morphogenesis protein [Acinetobacter bereziniae]